MKTQSIHPKWQFQTQRKFSPVILSTLAKQSTKTSGTKKGNAADQFLRAIVDAGVSNVAVLDELGRILYCSKAWRFFEQDNEPGGQWEVTHRSFERCRRFAEAEFDEDSKISLADDINQILIGKEKEFHRTYCYQPMTEEPPFVMHAARLNLPGSKFRVLMTYEAILPTRDGLKNSKDRLSQLLDTTNIMAWEGEVDGSRFSYVSEQAVKMLGFPLNAWYEAGFLAAHIHPSDRQRVVAAYRKQTRVAENFDLTFRMLDADGRVVWVQNLISITHEQSGARRMHGFLINISERKRAEEALKDLGARLIAAQEEERKRIARELHDDLSQRLAVLSIELEQLGQKLQNPLEFRERLEQLQLQAQEITTDIHRLSYKLHPSKLDHLGLATAVKSLCDELSQGGKPKVRFHQSGVPAALPKEVTLCIFRIAQEALRNSVKHSGADSAKVVLKKSNNQICLSVSDNGCGFDTNSAAMEQGLGFISMKERLRIVGGKINIYSHPHSGTRIEVSVPLTQIESQPRNTNLYEYSTLSVH